MLKTVVVALLLVVLSQTAWTQDAKKANNLFEAGDYEAAIAEYETLLEEDKENTEYNYRLAICFLNTNIDKSKALPFLQKVTAKADYPENAMYLLGRAYHFAYKFDKAIESYNAFKQKGKGNEANLKDVIQQIEYCQNAKELMKFPVSLTFENLGEKINSAYPDYYPFVPVDESFIAFNSRRDDGSEERPDGSFYSNIYVSYVQEGKFDKAKNIGEKINRPNMNEEIIGLSADGSKALLNLENSTGTTDLYSNAVQDGAFDIPKKLEKEINSKFTEIAASMSADGQAIYFASDRPDGYGGVDLYVSRLLPNGKWGPAQNLGPTINTPSDEDFPNISPDGNTLHFSSKGHTSMGGYDIFAAEWDATKRKFGKIRNMGFPINTPEDNMNFRISETGRYGYISALRKEGYGDLDIYRVTFNEVEPKYTVLKGIIKTSEKVKEVDDIFVTVMDVESGEIYGDYLPNPNTMRYVIILPPGKFNLVISASGFEEFNENIDIFDKSSYRSEIKKDIILQVEK
jgi:tetratricopeptide (TPR) repeat protein